MGIKLRFNSDKRKAVEENGQSFTLILTWASYVREKYTTENGPQNFEVISSVNEELSVLTWQN